MIEYSEGDRVIIETPGEVVEVYRCDHGNVITHYAVQLDSGPVVAVVGRELHPADAGCPCPAEPVEDGVHEWVHA